MRYRHLCKSLLEKIIGIKIRRITYPQTEKPIEGAPLSKSIRLDVYVEDDQGTIYNIEMQTTGASQPAELAKRIRYYGAQIDMNVLEKGRDYEELPKTFIIFICTFDPFQRGLSVYKFRRRCDEALDLTMGDETTTVFLCTNGRTEGVDPDIISFLRYVDGQEAEGAFTRAFAQKVEDIKEHVEMRREYMTLQLELRKELKKERAEWIEQGFERGIEQGMERGIEQGIEKGTVNAQVSALHHLIDKAGWTLEQAMEMMGLPVAERNKYAALLQS